MVAPITLKHVKRDSLPQEAKKMLNGKGSYFTIMIIPENSSSHSEVLDIPDDYLTEEDKKAHEEAVKDLKNGKNVVTLEELKNKYL